MEKGIQNVFCLDRLMIGVKSSDCLVPCKSTQTSIIKSSEYKSSNNSAYITFSDTVKLTKITVDKFLFMESLNFLGSNLGLWPGLGLYQLLEGVISLVVAWKCMKTS